MENNFQIAMKYRDAGFSIIPIVSPTRLEDSLPTNFLDELEEKIEDCKYDDPPVSEEVLKEELFVTWCKRPAIKSWAKYQKRIAGKDEVRAWFDHDKDANIAIVTGKLSNLVVVDLDTDEAVKTFHDKGWFDGAGVVKTSRGYHLYFSYPDFEVRNSANKKLGIDIRGEGGYVAAPPSVHGSWMKYEWKNRSILEQKPIALPHEIFEFARTKKDTAKAEQTQSNNNTAEPHIHDSFAEIFAHGCDDGERHDWGIKVAGHFFGKGLNETEVLTLMTDWNKKNRPPLADKEILQMVKNIAKHEKQKSPTIDIESFLWNENRIIADGQKKSRVPFAGNNLLNLEDTLSGGLVGGCLYLLGGVPSAGKTAVVNCIADNICLADHPVLIFSYDDSPMELNNRTLARFSNYKMEVINNNGISQNILSSIYKNSGALQSIIKNKYLPSENYEIELWSTLVEQIIKKHHKPPVIFIDYLKRLITKKKTADERMRIDEITKQLDELAKKYNLPVFAISEINRESYRAGQSIGMASFKESGGLEYSASWLGILASFEEKNGEYKLIQNWESAIRYSGNIDLVILKAKRGTGKLCRIPLNINTQKMLVVER